MSKKNLNEPNPKLKEGDRIVVLYVEGEEIPIESKGIVVGMNNQPKFKPSDPGYGYWVEFYDKDTNEFINKLTMLPESDIWFYDKDYYENENLKESLFSITKKNINKIKI
jgi:hypothetical protein